MPGDVPADAGVVTLPVTGAPLSWRHLLGWHPRSAAASAAAGAVSGHTRAAYAQAVERSESYTRWLATHPGSVPRPDGYSAPWPGATAATRAARPRSFSVTLPPASCEFTARATVL